MIERLDGPRMDLKDFFLATDARQDRWQQLNALARSIGQGLTTGEIKAQTGALLRELEPLENYWAYPGAAAMAELRHALEEGRHVPFARRVERISRALLRGLYRHDT